MYSYSSPLHVYIHEIAGIFFSVYTVGIIKIFYKMVLSLCIYLKNNLFLDF